MEEGVWGGHTMLPHIFFINYLCHMGVEGGPRGRGVGWGGACGGGWPAGLEPTTMLTVFEQYDPLASFFVLTISCHPQPSLHPSFSSATVHTKYELPM
jgi:hypothetical protein